MNGKSVGKRTAREKADGVYRQYKADGGSLPVKIEKLIKDGDIDVVYFDGPQSNLSGMLLAHDDKAIIVVNKCIPAKRQRFTLAHELGHYLLHKTPGSAIFHRDERSSQGTDRVEVDANAFAAELLMPADEVRARAAELGVDLLEDDLTRQLAGIFDVSIQAMSIRLQQLGIIDIDAYW